MVDLSLCVTILLYNWDVLDKKAMSFSIIELFVESLKILSHRILMMEYCLTEKAYIQEKKECFPFCQKAHTQICYPELFYPNLRILNVPLDVQVLVLIFCCRYICTKKKAHHHYLRSPVSLSLPVCQVCSLIYARRNANPLF